MSELDSGETSQDPAIQLARPIGAGGLLRAAREAAGVSLHDFADVLKVPVRRLQAMETDRFDLLPDASFVRALAASMCRSLRIETAPVLALLPLQTPLALERRATIRPHSFRMDDRGFGRGPSTFSRPLLGLVVLLVVAAGMLMLLPRERLGEWTANFSTWMHERFPVADGVEITPALAISTAPVSADAFPAEPAALSKSLDTSTSTNQPGMQIGSTAAPSRILLNRQAPSGVLVPATPVSLANQPMAQQPGGDPASLIQIRAGVESWIKVTDANGVVLLQKNVAAGSTEILTGAVPLSVVIGRADGTEVLVRGKTMQLGPVTRNNVARFEVR